MATGPIVPKLEAGSCSQWLFRLKCSFHLLFGSFNDSRIHIAVSEAVSKLNVRGSVPCVVIRVEASFSSMNNSSLLLQDFYTKYHTGFSVQHLNLKWGRGERFPPQGSIKVYHKFSDEITFSWGLVEIHTADCFSC